jgi:quercetin dioxygenase-like cupin family protein
MLPAMDDPEVISRSERREVLILSESEAMTITWSHFAGGERGTDLLVHREHTDSFYILEGALTVELGPEGEPLTLSAGGFVSIPPGVVHGFVNHGPAEARWLNVHTPDQGFAEYLRSLRDGTKVPFDSYDPPPDGGLPADAVTITRAG